MLQNVDLKFNQTNKINFKNNTVSMPLWQKRPAVQNNKNNNILYAQTPQNINLNTSLTETDKVKYNALVNFMADVPASLNSEGIVPRKQLDILLKNGKLLSRSNHDNSSVLDNLYDIATKPRIKNIDPKTLISNTLDLISNPRFVTQNFGDIPYDEKTKILSELEPDSIVRKSPRLMDVSASGTCAAASLEVNMADKYPAEFSRWISKLSSENEELFLQVDLSAISQNKLDAANILNLLDAKRVNFSFLGKNKVKISLDKHAYTRAAIQDKYWDYGERNVADVLVQSAIMQLGSQNTYDSLTDTRAGSFSENSQGLIEIEKTFVESLIKNKEISSLVYQKLDEEGNLLGYSCSFDKMEEHLTNTIDSGEDVIVGYVLTNETAGVTQSPCYSPDVDGAPNKIISGHEISIVDYIKDAQGKTTFVCIDTDDDNPQFVKYDADWLLPKLHHAGYPAKIVADDEKEILKNAGIM